jgi:uncharacterized membrane protein YdjX (TVP38/TMEM64 family)
MMRVDEAPVTGTSEPIRRWRLRRLAPVAAVVLVMALVFAMGWHRFVSLETLVRHRAAIDGFVHAHYALAVVCFIGIYIAVAALSVPAAWLVTVAGGVLFGWRVGGPAAIIGATIGATIIFLVARTACGEFLVRRAGPQAAKIADGFRADAFSYLLFLRLVPAFPFVLVNIVPALAGIRLDTFVAATALGIIPGTFAYALAGAGLDSAIRAQEGPYKDCIAAGRGDCQLDFTLRAAITPELVAAIIALIIVALIPIVLRRWRARGAGSSG